MALLPREHQRLRHFEAASVLEDTIRRVHLTGVTNEYFNSLETPSRYHKGGTGPSCLLDRMREARVWRMSTAFDGPPGVLGTVPYPWLHLQHSHKLQHGAAIQPVFVE